MGAGAASLRRPLKKENLNYTRAHCQPKLDAFAAAHNGSRLDSAKGHDLRRGNESRIIVTSTGGTGTTFTSGTVHNELVPYGWLHGVAAAVG